MKWRVVEVAIFSLFLSITNSQDDDQYIEQCGQGQCDETVEVYVQEKIQDGLTNVSLVISNK